MRFPLHARLLGEFIGTFALVFAGTGAIGLAGAGAGAGAAVVAAVFHPISDGHRADDR